MGDIPKAGNVLDELLGLNPGDPGAAKKIWNIVSKALANCDHVDLTFHHWDYDQTDGKVEVQYSADNWTRKKVLQDCAALKQLGFTKLWSTEAKRRGTKLNDGHQRTERTGLHDPGITKAS